MSFEISRIHPQNGIINSQNITITIYGENFTQDVGVYFNNELVENPNVRCTVITFTVPVLTVAGINTIQLKTTDHVSAIFDLCVSPLITSITPDSIPLSGLTQIVVNGYGFTNTTLIYLDNTALVTTYISNTQLATSIPPSDSLQQFNVRVKTDTVYSPYGSIYLNYLPPKITSISQNKTNINTAATVTITGTNFGTDSNKPSNLTVQIAGYVIPSDNVNYVNPQTIIVVLPKEPDILLPVGDTSMYVIIGSNKSNPVKFTYLPVITELSQSSIIMGEYTPITINGYGFNTTTSVYFGNKRGENVNVIDNTKLTVIPPSSKIPGIVMVNVTTSRYASQGSIPFTYTIYTISSVYPEKAYIDASTELTVYGNGLGGEVTCNIGPNYHKKICNDGYHSDVVFILDKYSNISIGTQSLTISKHGSSSDSIPFPYLTRIVDIVPDTILVNEFKTITMTVLGKCDASNSLIQLYANGAYVPATDISFILLDIPETCPKTHITKQIKRTCSVLHFVMTTTQLVPTASDVSLYIDGIIHDTSVLYYITPFQISPEKIHTSESISFDISGNHFRPDTKLIIDGTIYNYSEQTETLLRFPLPPFPRNRFVDGTLQLSEKITTPIHFFVYPQIDYITSPAEEDEFSPNSTIIYLYGNGFDTFIPYVMRMDETVCQYSYISESSIRVVVPELSTNLVDKQFIITIYDQYTSTDITIYSSLFTYSAALVSIDPKYNGYSTTAQYATIYGNNFNDSTIIMFDNEAIPSSAVSSERNSTHINFALPSSNLSKISQLYTITNNMRAMKYLYYTYIPSISGLNVDECAVNNSTTNVTIYGGRFKTALGDDHPITLYWNDIETAYTATNSNTITLTAPPSSTPKIVTVYAKYADIQTNIEHFIYRPYIESLSHTTGYTCGSNAIYIYGKGFGEHTCIFFGNSHYITEFLEFSETAIKFIVPPSGAGLFTVNISVEVNDIKSINEISYTYILPTLTSISKSSGIIHGGEEIIIYGEGFSSAIEILFGSVLLTETEFIAYDTNIIKLLTPCYPQAGEITVQLRVAETLSESQLSFTYLNHTIESIYPDHGRICGGEIVLVSGDGLSYDVELYFGSTLVNSALFIEVDSKYIKLKTPSYFKTGIVPIKARLNGVYSENVLKYQYKPHTITSVYPDNSLLSGGDLITIHGSGLLSDDLIINLGEYDIHATSFLSQSSTTVTFYAPTMTFSGTYDIVALIHNVPSDKSLPFYYKPRILALSQSHSPVNSSIQLTIYGEGFSNKAIVRFGCHLISHPIYDATYGTLSFPTPIFEVSQHVLIQVTIDGISTNHQGFSITPLIKTITPMPWIAGDVGDLYIRGIGFSPTSYVSIQHDCKSTLISPSKLTPTMIVVPLPTIKDSGEVKIGVNSDLNEWVYYTTAIYPKITRLSETKGTLLGNNTIYIYGHGFIKNMRVKIGATDFIPDANVQFINHTTYSVKMPPSPVLKEISLALWTKDFASNHVPYIYSPSITSITPNWSPLYTERPVTISGAGFTDVFNVLFQNKAIPAEHTKFNYDTKDISVVLPSSYEVEKKSLKVQIEYNNTLYDSSNMIDFYYAPEISSISQHSTPATAQGELTIYGRGFYTSTFVKFGSVIVRPENITIVSSTQLIAQLPIFQTQGTYGITVITNNIPSAVPFPFAVSAEIGSITPSSAPTSGNIPITINGSGFTEELTLLYNSVVVPYKFVSSNQLQFQLPESIPGSNTISLQCSRYYTSLTANLLCYPTIYYMKQQYDRVLQKTVLSIYGSGFTSCSRISVGDRQNLVPTIHDNILVLSLTEPNNYAIEPSLPVTVTTNGYTSSDAISYSNFPLVTTINKTSGSVGGNDEIVLIGAGFDKTSTVLLVEQNIEIVPSVVYANRIVFTTPAIASSATVHFVVKSNNHTSQSIEYNYAPFLKSTSITYCNVGEEPFIKIYGDGFEKYNTEIVLEEGTCTFSDYINDKIVQGQINAFDYPGIVHLSVSVRQIESINSLTFEIKPIITDINQEFANIHGGKVTIMGKGIANATLASFVYKTKTYTFPITVSDCGCASYSQYSDEHIILQYSSVPELMELLTQNNNQALPIDLYLHVNGAKSLPFKWQIKHIHHDAEIDSEITKILYLCNQYLSNTFLVNQYQIITPYSYGLQSAISDAIISIFQLTGEYLNPKSTAILSNALINVCAPTLAPERAVQNMISQLVSKVLYSLQSGSIISTSLVPIQSPLILGGNFGAYIQGHCDYYFQEVVCEHEPIICAHDFYECLSYRMDASMNVEFEVNDHKLSRTCLKLAKSLLRARFILCNNQGKFVGTSDDAPDGNIPELFIYKLLSATIHHPYQTSNIIDTHSMKAIVANSEQYLATQLQKIFKQNDVLNAIYNTLVVTYHRTTNHHGDCCYHPLPFKSGDRLRLPIFIGGNIIFTDPAAMVNVNIPELFYGACVPNRDNRDDAFVYLLTIDGKKVRNTHDLYEIMMG